MQVRIKEALANKYQTSWELLVSSVKFINKNKDLMILPIVSTLLTLSFCLLVLLALKNYNITSINDLFDNNAILAAILILAYCIISFVIIFFNAALIAVGIQRLKGEDTSILSGFNITERCFYSLISWGCVNIVISIIYLLSQRASSRSVNTVGKTAMIGWALITYFILPVLVCENLSPTAAISRIKQLMKQEWKKIVRINSIILISAAIVPIITGVIMLILDVSATQFAIFLTIYTLVISTFCAALETIIKSALYLHITQNIKVTEFEPALLQKAIVIKQVSQT